MKVSQIKSKVAAKCDKKIKKADKADRKTGRKCGALAAFLAVAAMLCGCMHPEGQPSRSQTQHNDFSRCIVIVAARCGVTNETVVAESADSVMPIELFTQTMKNEGSERNSPTMTPTQTTDVKPEIAVGVGGSSAGVGGGTSAATAKKGLCERIGGAADAVVDALPSKGDDAAAPAAQSAAQPAAAPAASSSAPAAQSGGASCPDGNCPASGEADCPNCHL